MLKKSPSDWSHRRQKGYVALISVLMVGIIGVAITLSLVLLGMGSLRTSFAIEQSNQAKALANACAEEALQQIRDSESFISSGNLTLGQGTCVYAITSQGAQNRTITSAGTVGTIIRKNKIIINQISPSIILNLWQEVSSF
jgi:hypothetical protein